MRRPELWCLGLGLSLGTASVFPACGGSTATAPTKIEDAPASLVVAPERPQAKDPASPFRKPSKEPPPPRSEPQVSDARLAELLAEAETLVANGDRNGATLVLRECANKVPISPRCEGALGQLLVGIALRRAECRYYLAEAARVDDPQADAEFYRELGDALMGQSLYEDAASAYQRRIGRGAAEAEDYGLLATALQGLADRQEEAADALKEAFSLDPTKIEYLHDEGVLRGQVPGQAKQAAALLREFLARSTDADDARVLKLEARIVELEAVAAEESAAKGAGSPASPT